MDQDEVTVHKCKEKKNLADIQPFEPQSLVNNGHVQLEGYICFILISSFLAPSADASNDLSAWVGEELNVTDRPELTSAKVVISGGEFALIFSHLGLSKKDTLLRQSPPKTDTFLRQAPPKSVKCMWMCHET